MAHFYRIVRQFSALLLLFISVSAYADRLYYIEGGSYCGEVAGKAAGIAAVQAYEPYHALNSDPSNHPVVTAVYFSRFEDGNVTLVIRADGYGDRGPRSKDHRFTSGGCVLPTATPTPTPTTPPVVCQALLNKSFPLGGASLIGPLGGASACFSGCRVTLSKSDYTCGTQAGVKQCFYGSGVVGTFDGQVCTAADTAAGAPPPAPPTSPVPTAVPTLTPEGKCIKEGQSFGLFNGVVICSSVNLLFFTA